jgi:hypothetical protein
VTDGPTFVRVAVLVPCRNEAPTVAQVIRDFRAALPGATVYVFDNRSTDDTAAVARAAGAVVKREDHPGKGATVRRMFADVEADAYVLVDGDGTYAADRAPALIERLVREDLDMVTAVRNAVEKGAYRLGHRFGNAFLTGLVARLFGVRLSDMLSGYRVFSRRFVKSYPALATGFEIETELTIHALALRLPIGEVPTPYRERPAGSTSKLHAVKDGIRILWTISALTRRERPVAFFGTLGSAAIVAALILAYPLFVTYLETGLVPRFPTAILCTGLVLLGGASYASGIILSAVTRSALEVRRLAYLQQPGPCRVEAPGAGADGGAFRVPSVDAKREDPAAPRAAEGSGSPGAD